MTAEKDCRRASPLLKGCAGLAIGTVVLIVVGVLWIRHELRQSALECVQEWGRLAELPEDSSDLKVTTSGNAFTRRFEVTFTAPAESVSAWLAASPGIADSEVETEKEGVTRYSIDPGGGAVFAEVEVSHSGTRVRIDVHWS